eukprot:1157619-Pelagomonas_calceolata.AAC.31
MHIRDVGNPDSSYTAGLRNAHLDARDPACLNVHASTILDNAKTISCTDDDNALLTDLCTDQEMVTQRHRLLCAVAARLQFLGPAQEPRSTH